MSTQPSLSSSSAPRQLVVPKQGADPSKVRSFFDSFFDPQSSYRLQLAREWNLAKSFHESVQWVRLDTQSGDPRRAARWTQQNPAEDIPKPVQNEIISIIDNETAKLGRRQSQPYVRAVRADVGQRGGATLANDVLKWHLDTPQVNWPTKRREGIFRDVLYGMGIWKSYWETDFRDVVRVGASEAVRCEAGCGFTLASAKIPTSLIDKVPLGAPVQPDEPTALPGAVGMSERVDSYTASACFDCGGALAPADLLPQEAQQQDSLGRPLGEDLAKGDAQIEVVSPHDFFISNEGIGENPYSIEWFGQSTPRSLDWIGTHYDVQVDDEGRYWRDGQEIKPEDPITIANHHPVLGEYGYWSGGSRSVLDRTVYRNHTRVREFYCLPNRRFPLGRMIVMAGGSPGIILVDDNLMQPSRIDPGTYFPRVKYNVARFWPRDGEFFSQGICVPLFSPQMRINMTYSQIVANRETNGVDAVLVTNGMRLHSPGWAKNYAGRVASYTPDPENPQKEPKNIPARVMDPAVFQEVDRTREHMQQAAGAQDVDIGKAPRNVSAATAIQLLQERASERRDSREQDLRECFKGLFSHHLLLLAEKVIEPRFYMAPGKGKSWEMKEFIGARLKGFCDIVIDEEAGYDLRAFEREGLIQAQQMGLVIFDTALKRREAMKTLSLSGQYADEDNVQVDDAERKWFLFRDQQEVPVIDPTEDSHNIHWQVYGKFLKSDDGLDMKDKAGWKNILPLIAGWEQNLQIAQALDAAVRMATGGQQPGMMPVQLPPEIAANPQLGMLPGDKSEQILVVWAKMLQAKQSPIDILGQDFPALFTRFKAVTEAHRLLAQERKDLATPMGMPASPIAAPGGGMTPAGTEPSDTIGGDVGPGAPSMKPPQPTGRAGSL